MTASTYPEWIFDGSEISAPFVGSARGDIRTVLRVKAGADAGADEELVLASLEWRGEAGQ